MSLFRAAAGLAIGAGAAGLVALGLDPDFLVDGDRVNDLATALGDPNNATALGDFAQLVDKVPEKIPEGMHLFENVGEAGKHLLVSTEHAMPFLDGHEALNTYFGNSTSEIATQFADKSKIVSDYLAGLANSAPDAIPQEIPEHVKDAWEYISGGASQAIDKLGDTGLQRDLTYSTAALVGGGGATMGVIGAMQGNNDKPVVGQFTAAEAQRAAGRGGVAAGDYDLSQMDERPSMRPEPQPQPGQGFTPPKPGGAVERYLQAMQEQSDPALATQGRS